MTIWEWLQEPKNQGALKIIGGLLAFIIIGGWTGYTYINDNQSKTPLPVKYDSNNEAINPFDQTTHDNVVIYPKCRGNDVLIPHRLILQIPNFDESKPVYAATHMNGWLRFGKEKASEEVLKITTMIREGNFWVARNMANVRFHPAQLLNQNLTQPYTLKNIGWAQVENIYDLTESFVDMSSGSPTILVECRTKP